MLSPHAARSTPHAARAANFRQLMLSSSLRHTPWTPCTTLQAARAPHVNAARAAPHMLALYDSIWQSRKKSARHTCVRGKAMVQEVGGVRARYPLGRPFGSRLAARTAVAGLLLLFHARLLLRRRPGPAGRWLAWRPRGQVSLLTINQF